MGDPLLGLFFHWLGGLASASFYNPYRSVNKWAWETYWLVGGFFRWIIAPWILALVMTHDLKAVLTGASALTLFRTYLFGVLWAYPQHWDITAAFYKIPNKRPARHMKTMHVTVKKARPLTEAA